jgi:PAS domain S-box-containing protein
MSSTATVPRALPAPLSKAHRRVVLQIASATLPPLVAFVVQRLLWTHLAPFSWFLFYPTVFISSWLGGFWSGLGATLLSTALVWSSFLPFEGVRRVDDPKYVFTAVLFVMTGVLFSIFHGRLRRANRAVADALGASQQANESLRSVINERRIFAAVIDNSSDFIGIADAHGKPVYVNPAGRRMVGLSPDYPVQDTNILDYYPPELRELATESILRTTVEKGAWQGETYFKNWQTQERIPVSDTHFVIRDPEHGEPLGMATITRDISELERARTATRARDDALAVVAHDLRNPLGTIVMQAAMLEQRDAAPKRPSRRPAETIRRAANRMNKLIDDLLDVTRMEAGRLTLDRERACVREILVDVIETQKVLAAVACVTLVLDLPDDLPDVWADRDRLQQVFENLIGNAIKFTTRGGRIIVGAKPDEHEVVFSVTDTAGAGIAAEDLPHLFDRFWQARRGTHQGAGLGLPIARGIVEAHGGHIWAESKPGSGSTFSFTIPIASSREFVH